MRSEVLKADGYWGWHSVGFAASSVEEGWRVCLYDMGQRSWQYFGAAHFLPWEECLLTGRCDEAFEFLDRARSRRLARGEDQEARR
ncbi:hypothetical protein TOPH_05767 [Tolypocladium ophioglossoides CBS 100239]|uniref:Uncharacterized protein n=1 Tax=Tolypocladium ophioglossoides (strain CBS 100239) TaxID=1163406 RepID=A0A0L0N6S9_TOLOC|nr:hypothetical protein TOPH_05767 [Tolypocladium ophioglossoides CBS 100239]